MKRVPATLREQMTEGHDVDGFINANLKELGFGG